MEGLKQVLLPQAIKFNIVLRMTLDAEGYKVTLLEKKKITKNALTFYFDKPAGFTYLSGQYIKIKLDIKNPDERGSSRYFTLSSAPKEKNLAITTKILDSIFKKRLGNLKIGEQITIRGPYGNFTIDNSRKKEIVFISSGTGSSPFRSILVSHSTKHRPIILIALFETNEDVLFKDEFEKINYLKFVPILFFKQGNEMKVLNMDIVRKYVANIKESVYYIAGPENFVSKTSRILLKLGINEKNIITEDFPGYK